MTALLLTPGPLTVSDRVRAAMDRDWGSRDADFIALTAAVRADVLRIAGADPDTATAIPLQGAGTFAVEAMLATFAPTDRKTLVVVNGAYGHRMADILYRLGRPYDVLEFPETQPVDPADLGAALSPAIGAVAVVQCETTTGILNPIADICAACQAADLPVLLDAMSAFGAIPTRMDALGVTAVAASSNKCLQGVPGLGLVVCNRAALAAAPQVGSLALDLAAQSKGFDATGEWRFTPPTHVVAALAEALAELAEEGGPEARLARYSANCVRLIDGMAARGFRSMLAPEDQAPIIVTFAMPDDRPGFDFGIFYEALKSEGYVIYPGKLTQAPSFRVGCIGAVDRAQIDGFLAAVSRVL